jgi:GT2 family glycosyltransferase
MTTAVNPDVSVVIVSFNCRELVRECLRRVPPSLSGYTSEIIVVDNGSHDGTPEVIRTEFPHVHLMATGENLGFAAGNNRGLQAARGRVIVFLNPDTEPAEGSLARLVEALDADRTLGIVGPRLTYPDGALQPSVRGFPTFGVALLVLLKLYRVSRRLPAVARYDRRDLDYNRAQDVEQLMGACLAMPHAVVDAMQGFDERFWMWFEEVDLCLRVRKAGWRVRYCPEANVMHRLNQSTVLLHSAFLQRMYARSLVAFFEKHHPQWQTRVLRSVSGVGVVAARVVQAGRRLRHGTGEQYRLDAHGARVSKGLD